MEWVCCVFLGVDSLSHSQVEGGHLLALSLLLHHLLLQNTLYVDCENQIWDQWKL